MENGFVTSDLNVNISNARVSSLMESEHRCWDHDTVTNIFGTWDRDLILQIPLSSRRNDDLWYWLADPRGSYTVHSCYKLLNPITIAPSSSVWHRMWNLKVLGKVKNFIWPAATNVLPTNDNLIHRRVEVLPTCYVCNASTEMVSHVLVDCNFAKFCWISSPIRYVAHCSSFLLWLENMFGRYKKEDCELAVMIFGRL